MIRRTDLYTLADIIVLLIKQGQMGSIGRNPPGESPPAGMGSSAKRQGMSPPTSPEGRDWKATSPKKQATPVSGEPEVPKKVSVKPPAIPAAAKRLLGQGRFKDRSKLPTSLL